MKRSQARSDEGGGHFTKQGKAHDQSRDQFLENQGYKILRIPGYTVIREEGRALELIREFVLEAITAHSPSPPAPLPFVPQGRGEQDEFSEATLPDVTQGRGEQDVCTEAPERETRHG